MTRDQRIVLAGAASGIAAMMLGMWLLARTLPAPALESTADRIVYALWWDVLAAVPLFAMLAAVGNARFLSEAIDPTLGREDRNTVVNGRVADNTSQQFLLFLAGSLGLAATVPAEGLNLVGAAAIVFVVARIAFWIGYRLNPLYRAFGFAATAYLNLGLLAATLWLGFT